MDVLVVFQFKRMKKANLGKCLFVPAAYCFNVNNPWAGYEQIDCHHDKQRTGKSF